MKVKYNIILDIEIEQEINTLDGLKSGHELAQDVCALICDEAVQTNSSVKYDIISSSVNVNKNLTPEWKKKFLQKFEKTC